MITAAATAIMYKSVDGPVCGLGAGEGEADGVDETVGEVVVAGILVGGGVWVVVGVELGAVVTEGNTAAPTPTRVSADEAQYELVPAKLAEITYRPLPGGVHIVP
jgi:hypothetical protein